MKVINSRGHDVSVPGWRDDLGEVVRLWADEDAPRGMTGRSRHPAPITFQDLVRVQHPSRQVEAVQFACDTLAHGHAGAAARSAGGGVCSKMISLRFLGQMG